MSYVEETVHIRDLKIGDIIDSLETRVLGFEVLPASNLRALSNKRFDLSDGRVLLLRERTVVRCRHGDITKIISSTAVPEYIKVRREKRKPGEGTLTDVSSPRRAYG